MIKKMIFFFSCLLGIVSPFEAFGDSSKEFAFYAITSLQYHVKQVVKELSHKGEECVIPFEEADVEELWLSAYESRYCNAVEEAKRLYDSGVKENNLKTLVKAKRLLESIWKKSNDCFFHKITLREKDESYNRYFISQTHWLKGAMDKIFSSYNPIDKLSFLKKSGFEIVSKRSNPLYVVSHNKLPGYLVKLYLNSEHKNKVVSTKWLVNRCLGAENVRSLIRKKKLKHFTVPDKWIYLLPGHDALNESNNGVLLVTHMKITSEEKTKWAWKNKITPKHLDELFCILSHGFSSTYLVGNIPYCKDGSFACLDTEHPQRVLPLNKISSYLSPPMRAYWEKLIKKGGRFIKK